MHQRCEVFETMLGEALRCVRHPGPTGGEMFYQLQLPF